MDGTVVRDSLQATSIGSIEVVNIVSICSSLL